MTNKLQEPIARTGFLVSLVSYALFWLIDLAHPGFVARFFSVHIFLLTSLIFGIWYGSVVEEFSDHRLVQLVFSIVSGLIVFVITWNSMSQFGLTRWFASLIGLLLPWIMWRLIRYK